MRLAPRSGGNKLAESVSRAFSNDLTDDGIVSGFELALELACRGFSRNKHSVSRNGGRMLRRRGLRPNSSGLSFCYFKRNNTLSIDSNHQPRTQTGEAWIP